MAHFQWFSREGKQVLLLDFTEHSAKRVQELAREVQQIITSQPPGSVRVLADFTGASITGDTLSNRESRSSESALRPAHRLGGRESSRGAVPGSSGRGWTRDPPLWDA